MFKKAQLKLAVTYTILFLLFFWVFSFSVYFWMDHSFGEGYISKVRQAQQTQAGENKGEFDDSKTVVATIAGDVTLNQLLEVLIILNAAFLVVIPIFSWLLAKITLSPIELIHEQQKQFVSDASHELRTPLSIMKGELDVSLQKKRTPKAYEGTLISTREEVNRLIYLVENLLFLARIDQKHFTFRKEPLDLVDIVNSVISKLQKKIQAKHILLHFTPLSENKTFLGQEILFSQLFFNLIDNAVKYTPEKGEIWVSMENEKHNLVIAIRDSGIGISKEQKEKIFDRFYRVDSSRSGAKGYGLGLAIVKTIILKYKGKIEIFSEKDKGAKFIVTLPNA